jgi:hypothetical protein
VNRCWRCSAMIIGPCRRCSAEIEQLQADLAAARAGGVDPQAAKQLALLPRLLARLRKLEAWWEAHQAAKKEKNRRYYAKHRTRRLTQQQLYLDQPGNREKARETTRRWKERQRVEQVIGPQQVVETSAVMPCPKCLRIHPDCVLCAGTGEVQPTTAAAYRQGAA